MARTRDLGGVTRLRSLAILAAVATALAGCVASPLAPAPSGPSPGAGPEAPWPALHAAPVRPGAKLYDVDRDLSTCTLGFVLTTPDNATVFVATASHCVAGFSVGTEIPIAQGAARAVVAYCSFGARAGTRACPDSAPDAATDPQMDDFALLAVHDEDRRLVHPAVLGFGGPTGIARDLEKGARVLTYGNTDLRDGGRALPGEPGDAREGEVWDSDEWITEAVITPPSLPGDSGGPALDGDGGAIGVLKYVGANVGRRTPPVHGFVNLDAALPAAELELGTSLRLATWPLLRP